MNPLLRNRQTTIFDETVASRIEALLARCDRIRLARDIERPFRFDREGEAHAESVAQRDKEQARG